MKRVGWILLAVSLTALQVLVVFAPTPPMNFDTHPILLSAILALFLGPGLGGVCMVFRIIRYERRLFPVILVALLIPNSFLWYYFERVRPERQPG
jgi:hypothetical protein